MKAVRWRQRRLPAGALLFVLVISLIVASVLLSLLLLNLNRQSLQARYTQRRHLTTNVASGLAYTLAHARQPYFQPQEIDLFSDGRDSVLLERRPWGLFDVAIINASKGALHDTLIALLGSGFSHYNQGAIYLANKDKPLTIGQDAQIMGDCYLPQSGIRTALGLTPKGPRRSGPAVLGTVTTSLDTLPLTINQAFQRARDLSQLRLTGWLPAHFEQSTQLRSAQRSFAAEPLVFYQTGPLILQGQVLRGQIVVASGERLTVEPNAQLDGILLLAPVIVLKSGFQGAIQAFARDSLIVEAGCNLRYPSVLCAASTLGPTVITLGGNVRVSGIIAAIGSQDFGYSSVVKMRDSVQVEGQLFSAGLIENCNAVRGTVMCRQLLYRSSSSYYENYLVNARIDRTALPASYLTSSLLNPGAPAGVVEWLH